MSDVFNHRITSLLASGSCILALALAPAALAAETPAGHGAVLQYHHVDASTPPVTSILPEQFERQLALLTERRYSVWPLDRLVSAIQSGATVPDHVVAITFDDAFASIYDVALPLLRKYEMPFTLFVATDLVGSNDRFYLTWNQIRELKRQGALIANHSRTHLHMLRRKPGETEKSWLGRLQEEVEGAQQIIERETGDAPMLFAYPYGEYSGPVKRLLLDLGYTSFGQQSGPVSSFADPGALPRFPMSGVYGNLDGIGDKLDALPMPVTPAALDVDPLLAPGTAFPLLTIELASGHEVGNGVACYASGQGRITVQTIDSRHFTAVAREPIPIGRSRYNCTIPVKGRRYEWYSQMWIRKRDDGSWYEEP